MYWREAVLRRVFEAIGKHPLASEMFLMQERSLIVAIRTLWGFTGNNLSCTTTACGIYPQLMRAADRANRVGGVATKVWATRWKATEGFHVKLRGLTHICEGVCG